MGESIETLLQAPPPVPLGDEQVGTGAAEGVELVKAHHGSLSRQRRLLIEDELKRGELRGLVATSTLELGIDMGAVDLVVQVASPGSVASGLQRIGRAGHRVGEPSRGRIFPKHRADLLEAAAVVERMHLGEVEHTHYLRNPIDVAAQQIVAMCAMDDWPIDRLSAVLRRCAASLSCPTRCCTVCWNCCRAPTRPRNSPSCGPGWCGIGPRACCGAGPEPSASQSPTPAPSPTGACFGVFLPDGTRVGELDEEMVYESRVGETFLLGASTWRIIDITFDRVVVTPAPGELGKMPFWHGDGPGRPIELGRAVGAWCASCAPRATPTRSRPGCGSAAASTRPPRPTCSHTSRTRRPPPAQFPTIEPWW